MMVVMMVMMVMMGLLCEAPVGGCIMTTTSIVTLTTPTQPSTPTHPHPQYTTPKTTYLVCIGLYPLLINHPQHCTSTCTTHRVATICVEVQSLCQHRCHFWCGHHSPQRQAIANALGHSNDIRDDVLILKTPVVGTGSSKSCLHFIGNANATCCTNHLGGGGGLWVGVLHVGYIHIT